MNAKKSAKIGCQRSKTNIQTKGRVFNWTPQNQQKVKWLHFFYRLLLEKKGSFPKIRTLFFILSNQNAFFLAHCVF